MPSLRQLRFLSTLAAELHFSRAAARCAVTQSTFSAAIKDMEAELGVQLAERGRRGARMTPIGAALAERAARVLAEVQDMEELARREAAEGPELLRLGAIPTVGPFIMPAALPRIRAAFPRMQVYLREELTDPLIAGLEDGRLDLALIALPYDLPESLTVAPLFEDGYRLARARETAPETAGAARAEGAAAPCADPAAELQEARLLLLERGHCLQRHALSSFPAAALAEDERFAATSLATLIAMVEEGMGQTLLPELAVQAGAARGRALRLDPLPGACPRRVALAWRRSAARGEEYRRIAEALRAARRDLDARAAEAAAG